MNFDEFTEAVVKALEEFYGPDMHVTKEPVMKNNGIKKTGIIFAAEKGEVGSVIYAEELFEQYKEGRTLQETIKALISLYESNKEHIPDINSDMFLDYEQIKGKLACRLVNYANNQEVMRNFPHRRYLDLAITYSILLDSDQLGMATVQINTKMINAWGITEEQLYQDAIHNMIRVLPYQMMDMRQMLKQMLYEKLSATLDDVMGMEERERILSEIQRLLQEEKDSEKYMYALTNAQKFYGAAVILYPGLLKKFSEDLDCNFFIFPSSVHELILVPEKGGESIETMKNMVREVNEQDVSAEELLSYEVYYYNNKTDKVSICGSSTEE